jgi:hypothetical protein
VKIACVLYVKNVIFRPEKVFFGPFLSLLQFLLVDSGNKTCFFVENGPKMALFWLKNGDFDAFSLEKLLSALQISANSQIGAEIIINENGISTIGNLIDPFVVFYIYIFSLKI